MPDSDMDRGFDVDYTSIAVHDAPKWLRRLRRDPGATPLLGQALPEFRYVVSHVGDEDIGGRLELMDAGPAAVSDTHCRVGGPAIRFRVGATTLVREDA